MRRFSLVLLVALTACTSLPTFVGQEFKSRDEFAAALQKQWTIKRLHSRCTEEARFKKDVFSQPPIMFMARNWEGEFTVSEGDDQYRVLWVAIAIHGQIKAYRLTARKGQDGWDLGFAAAPNFPFQPDEIRKLIQESEKAPNQPPEPMPLTRHGSS